MSIVKPKAISGFPEWLPEQRAVELAWIDTIRATFESYGYGSIETPAIEAVEVLAAKGGDTDKEIYALRRLAEEGGGAERARLALHYDLTVPLARYVAAHYNDLTFPFKRYQIQKAWRGERPQEGRFREFLQCDIDVIDNGEVSIEFDAELPSIIFEIIDRLDIGPVTIHINNRKILQGFYRGLGVEDVTATIRIVDKMDKIGPEQVGRLLRDELGLDAEVVDKCLALAAIKTPDASFTAQVQALGVTDPELTAGLDELGLVMARLSHLPAGAVLADLAIARGFDYYTGTVYEGKLADFPDYPTVFAGGRYANLVGSFLNRALPGVGISIGLTRIISKLFKEGRLKPGPRSPSKVLVAVLPGADMAAARACARLLRARGINTEVYHEAAKLAKQIRYADRKNIPYVWFPASPEGDTPHEVKTLASGQQVSADPESWRPA